MTGAGDQRIADRASLLAYLPSVLLFPLRITSAATILLFALMFGVGLQGLFGLILIAIALPWLIAWLERIVVSAADGDAVPPVFGGGQMFLASAAGWRLLVGPMLVFSLWLGIRETSPGLASTALAAGWFLFPAYMLIGAQFGLWAALNPVRLLATVFVCGWPYLLGSVFLTVIGLGLLRVSGQLSLYTLIALLLVMLVMCAHLVGAIAFFRAEALGLPPRKARSHAEDARDAEQAMELERVLEAVRRRLAGNDLAGACAALEPLADRVHRAVDFAEALFERVHQRTHKVVILTQGARLIGLLCDRRQLAYALEIFRRCLDHSPAAADYLSCEARRRLAEHARATAAWTPFEKLTGALEQLDAADPDAVELRLLAAADLIERRQDPDAAAALLARLELAGDDPRAGRRAALQRLAGGTSGA